MPLVMQPQIPPAHVRSMSHAVVEAQGSPIATGTHPVSRLQLDEAQSESRMQRELAPPGPQAPPTQFKPQQSASTEQAPRTFAQQKPAWPCAGSGQDSPGSHEAVTVPSHVHIPIVGVSTPPPGHVAA